MQTSQLKPPLACVTEFTSFRSLVCLVLCQTLPKSARLGRALTDWSRYVQRSMHKKLDCCSTDLQTCSEVPFSFVPNLFLLPCRPQGCSASSRAWLECVWRSGPVSYLRPSLGPIGSAAGRVSAAPAAGPTLGLRAEGWRVRGGRTSCPWRECGIARGLLEICFFERIRCHRRTPVGRRRPFCSFGAFWAWAWPSLAKLVLKGGEFGQSWPKLVDLGRSTWRQHSCVVEFPLVRGTPALPSR